ncbi:MAG: DUF5686 family protein [Bacteroidota bacterium]
MRYLLLLLLLTSLPFVKAQKTELVVKDIQTMEPVAFVKIGDGIIAPVLTDIDGRAALEILPDRNYSFTFFEYRDTTIAGKKLLESPEVLLVPDVQMMDEVVIEPGKNPAHRIIQNAMDHRKENDPLRNDAFRYDSYSKFYITGETQEPIDRDTITDTSALKTLDLLDRQYLFLTETGATRIFSPPNYDKEIVNSYNVSGVKDPMFATLVNQFQSFSFYDNNFEINQGEYINPIAPGSLRRYLFILEDTLFHGKDTTYTIKYRPRKGKNFEGLEGYLFVSTKNWALEKVIASPYEQSSFAEVKVIQSYRYTNDKKWFPHKLSTEFAFKDLAIGKYSEAIGKSNLYIKDVEFGIDVKKRVFNPVQLEVKPGALEDTNRLKSVRQKDNTAKERKTYHVIDSIGEENNLDKMVDAFKILSTGEVPLGVFGLPIDRIIDFNQQEGYRLGAGLSTNTRLSRWFKTGGYFAYGFRDKAWKWGGDLGFIFHQKNKIGLHFHFSDDLFERGGEQLLHDEFNIADQSLYRDFFINRLDRQRKAQVRLKGYIRQNLKVQLFGNYRRFWFSDLYRYNPGQHIPSASGGFDVAEVGMEVQWNIREKVMLLDDRRVSLGTKFPRINVKAYRGIQGLWDASYDYYRMNLTINQDFSIRGLGKLKLASKSGLTIGEVPLTLQQVQHGTARNWNLTVANTFETMRPAEFFSDRQTALFMRFRFLPIKGIADFTRPTFVVHNAAAVGAMNDQSYHKNYAFKVPEKGYYESGLIVEDLLVSGFNGYGVGVFYRYGPYAFSELGDNFVYKLSVTFNL